MEDGVFEINEFSDDSQKGKGVAKRGAPDERGADPRPGFADFDRVGMIREAGADFFSTAAEDDFLFAACLLVGAAAFFNRAGLDRDGSALSAISWKACVQCNRSSP